MRELIEEDAHIDGDRHHNTIALGVNGLLSNGFLLSRMRRGSAYFSKDLEPTLVILSSCLRSPRASF
ncbi:MAG: hypothetical protein WBA57_26250 [Elainellaceae cyanobacterium]